MLYKSNIKFANILTFSFVKQKNGNGNLLHLVTTEVKEKGEEGSINKFIES